MSKSTRGIRAAGVASLAVSLSIGVAAPAFAVPTFEFKRIGGADRYETAALVADEYGAKPDAILANGQPGFYADALASNYLSKVKDAPILLTRVKELPQSTLDQLDQMNAQRVTVVGGESVVPQEQVDQLTAAGYTVTRISGDDRFGTNAEVIGEGGAATGGIGLIATGFNFPDALAAGPFAYQGHPLGLSTTNDVKDEVLDALEADGVKEVLIFGGTDAVGAGVVSDLAARGITVKQRFAGADRSETSELAAEWALANLGFTNKHVGVASGYTEGYGADALAGGPLEGKEKSPMLITRNVDDPNDVLDYLKAHASTLETGHLFGGPAAVSAAAEAAMEKAAQGAGGTNQDFTVTPSGNQTVETGTVSQFTFSGIKSSTVDIMLTGCENVTTDANGVSTFPNSSNPGGSGNVANEGGAGANNLITVINGSALATPTQYADNVTVNNGSVSFTVSNNTVDCYVAVVFSDADTDNNLDLGTNNQPSEDFANSGDVNVIPPEAADNAQLNQVEVVTVDKAANLFTSNAATYYYDSNDEFLLDVNGNSPGTNTDDTVLTMEQFEARISAGDNVSGVYRNAPANQSTFRLNDDAPVAPANVDAKQPDGTTNAGKAGVEVEWTDSVTPTVASYNVYRATATQPTAIGGSVTCPSRTTAGAYSVIGTVQDTKTSGTYEFMDTTAQQPATGSDPANPQYCYYVTSVDQTGDEGPASEGDTTPTRAFPASTTTAMGFQGGAIENALRVTVDYTQEVNSGTVALDGSDFDVTATTGGTSEDLTILSAQKDGADNDNVDIVLSEAIPAGSTVTVTQRAGTDANTVCAGTATTNCAPAGQVVQLGTGDVAGPTATDAAFVDTAAGAAGVFGDEDGDEITVTYDEAVVVDGVGTITIDGVTYTESADLTIEPGGGNTLVVTVVDNAAVTDTAITNGVSEVDGTTNVEDAAGNPADGYPEIIN